MTHNLPEALTVETVLDSLAFGVLGVFGALSVWYAYMLLADLLRPTYKTQRGQLVISCTLCAIVALTGYRALALS